MNSGKILAVAGLLSSIAGTLAYFQIAAAIMLIGNVAALVVRDRKSG